MADTRVLLDRLREYRAGLKAQLGRLSDELQQLEAARAALDSVFEGDGAEEFRQSWQRTADRFRIYIEEGTLLANGLDARIADLETANVAQGDLKG